jgi:molybdate transport system substrate-binding protein
MKTNKGSIKGGVSRLAGMSLTSILILFLMVSDGLCAELYLFAGAGLRQPTDVVIARFEAKTGHKVFVSYDGGGKLMTRILASGLGDCFMPGAFFYIERLMVKGTISSFKIVAAHTPVVGVNRDASPPIRSFKDLAKPGLRLALGDPEAMAFGKTARKILQKAGMEKAVLKNVVVQGATVKQLALYVARGDVDASIIGRADAFQYRDRIRIVPIPEDYFQAETIAAAVLTSSAHPKIAAELCTFLGSEASIAVFEQFGFLPLRAHEE